MSNVQLGSRFNGGYILSRVPTSPESIIIGFSKEPHMKYPHAQLRDILLRLEHKLSKWNIPTADQIFTIHSNVQAGILPVTFLSEGVYWVQGEESQKKASTVEVTSNGIARLASKFKGEFNKLLPVRTCYSSYVEQYKHHDVLTRFLEEDLQRLDPNLVTEVRLTEPHKLKVTFLDKVYTLEVKDVNGIPTASTKKTVSTKPKVVYNGPNDFEQYSLIPE